MKDRYSLINIELNEGEQLALLGLIVASTNGIIAAGDPDGWLEDLESVEDKIRGAQDDQDAAHSRMPIIEDHRGA